jgi:hypothetical protein
MSARIAQDARANDFVISLLDPVAFLSEVVRNFRAYGPKAASVRFGITGAGKAPNYKIEEQSVVVQLPIGLYQVPITVTPGNTFSGRHHRSLPELDDLQMIDKSWSTRTMTLSDLELLLSRLMQSRKTH